MVTQAQIKELVKKMTRQEKAGLCSGAGVWKTKAIERLGVPSITMSDGPHGLRRVDENGDLTGSTGSMAEVCFPPACATACSFDRELLRRMGRALGREARSERIDLVLGPGVNIKRSPLCGRNFEYFSEDPVVAGELASALIQGIQSEGAGACIKHFAVNNQEERRMTISAEVSERALREIYLPAFEIAVKQADPVAVMCSYNRINGVYASENRHLLTEILREEWGYEGIVVTDWGAINDRVEGVRAGLDIEMPHVGPESDADIVEALEKGTLAEATLDAMVERILQAVYRLAEAGHSDTPYDRQADHELAREIEADSLVLLKNEPKVLPLDPATRIAFVGEFAAHPRYQGGGSSHIRAFRVADALHAAQKIAPVTYAQGYSDRDEEADRLRAEACAAAKAADVCVVFAGLPDAYESEGYDRRHLSLLARQNQLIEEIAKVQPNLVVVLHNGSPVTMPWLPRVPAVLEAYLGGQAVGEACVDVLFGRVTPSGHLAETFPLRLEDTPAYLSGSGEKTKVRYMEDVFVGYRYYDSRDKEVLFPFGHGLSYTTFGYSNLRIAPLGENRFTVSLDVENTGTVAGKEVVQLYVGNRADYAPRPRKELRNFAKIALAPGEKKRWRLRWNGGIFAITTRRPAVFARTVVTIRSWWGPVPGTSGSAGRSGSKRSRPSSRQPCRRWWATWFAATGFTGISARLSRATGTDLPGTICCIMMPWRAMPISARRLS